MSEKDIPFNIPYLSGEEQKYIDDAIQRRSFSAGGHYTTLCENWLQEYTKAKKILLTSSCTHALEMCALLLDIKKGDEVIMPSFNFVSAANAFVLRGAKIIFVDIDPATMNVDPVQISLAISDKTKAILVVHYGGVACDIDAILTIADKNDLPVIEDAAHAIGAYYKDQHLGTLGDFGTLSFHATKNIHCGEGGALVINNPKYAKRAVILREKGTNRQAFLKGEVDKYTWVDIGSSYLMSEISAAFLYAQLHSLEKVAQKRIELWEYYQNGLSALEQEGKISLLQMPFFSKGNGHVFYVKCKSDKERTLLIAYLKSKGVIAYFHYIPLHNSKAGKLYGQFNERDDYSLNASRQLLRLPIYYDLEISNCNRVVELLKDFYYEIY